MGKFNGKVAIVTGGSAGIGKEIAFHFAKEGCSTVICSRSEAKGNDCVENIKKETSSDSLFQKCDVKKSEQVQTMVKNAVKKFGRIDYLINNAGIGGYSKILTEYPEEIWDKVMAVNLKGAWLCMKYTIPEMLKLGKGSVVNVSSIAGLVGANWNVSPYSASKHAIIGLTKSAALEFAPKNIRINAICPAFTETEMLVGLFNSTGNPEKAKIDLAETHPVRRLGKPEEVAKTAVWLCSNEASFITGTAIPVDGGYTAQ